MEKVNLTNMFFFFAIILRYYVNSFLKHTMEANVLWF